MSTQQAYQKPLYGFRFVEIQQGDSLQVIAARELGDAALWYQLIALNGLVPPYITDDPTEASAGVLLSGGSLKVPAPQPVATTTTDPTEVFLSDIQLDPYGGLSVDDNGDFAVASGVDNLNQALSNRVSTDRGELIYHTDYGSRVRRLQGTVNGPTAGLLAAQYAKSAVQADPRVKQVNQAVADISGDAINVSVEVQPISGRVISVTATL
jgi:phage baseplate assembly protein W